ncbi:hypothetical protein ND973_13825 [Vibrio diabolicus]|uniref:hypothetical protein n=1 Tax=Vibrio parahaemolyticus TaxID=670 RepID=UPI0006A60521|nr:hypothetical protein ACX13_15180 [Vibrio parahaemolyticus]MCS0328190.1 hypothetical protein [Vibrio diabolicus]
MYVNAFKTLSKRLMTSLSLKSLSEGQVIASKLFGFSSTNAASASLVKASGKLTEKSFVESMQLPEVFEFTESECRTEAGIYEYDPYDITLELLSCMMTILIEESEHDREYCFSVLVDNEEFVVNHLQYNMDNGFELHVCTAATALSKGKVITVHSDEQLPDGYLDHVSFEASISRNSMTLWVDGKFSKTIDLSKSKVRLLSFNSEILSCVSPTEESRLQRCIQSMHNNFGSFTYNDLIKMGEGIEDQPVFLTNSALMPNQNQELLVCSDMLLNEGVITISSYLIDYESQMNWFDQVATTMNAAADPILYWKEAIETLKSLPNHLIEEPVRFLIMNNSMFKQYTVPIGVQFCISFDGGELGIGQLKLVKPRKA